MNRIKTADWTALADRAPAHAPVAGVDLVVVRWDDQVSVLYGGACTAAPCSPTASCAATT